MDRSRKLRRELGYELAKLSGLQESVDATDDDPGAKGLATQIREQAEVCLHLLDQYQSSVPSRMWSDAERRCQPLREELKRIGGRFRAASGEWELRTDERLWGRSWWAPTQAPFSFQAIMSGESVGGSERVTGSESWAGEAAVDIVRPIELALCDLALDPKPEFLPDDPVQMTARVSILVGQPPTGGAEIFGATLCTPEWLSTQCDGESVVPGDGLLVVRFEDFDEVRIRREVERFLSRIREETWGDAVTRIKEWFPCWEFDGCAP